MWPFASGALSEQPIAAASYSTSSNRAPSVSAGFSLLLHVYPLSQVPQFIGAFIISPLPPLLPKSLPKISDIFIVAKQHRNLMNAVREIPESVNIRCTGVGALDTTGTVVQSSHTGTPNIYSPVSARVPYNAL